MKATWVEELGRYVYVFGSNLVPASNNRYLIHGFKIFEKDHIADIQPDDDQEYTDLYILYIYYRKFCTAPRNLDRHYFLGSMTAFRKKLIECGYKVVGDKVYGVKLAFHANQYGCLDFNRLSVSVQQNAASNFLMNHIGILPEEYKYKDRIITDMAIIYHSYFINMMRKRIIPLTSKSFYRFFQDNVPVPLVKVSVGKRRQKMAIGINFLLLRHSIRFHQLYCLDNLIFTENLEDTIEWERLYKNYFEVCNQSDNPIRLPVSFQQFKNFFYYHFISKGNNVLCNKISIAGVRERS